MKFSEIFSECKNLLFESDVFEKKNNKKKRKKEIMLCLIFKQCILFAT